MNPSREKSPASADHDLEALFSGDNRAWECFVRSHSPRLWKTIFLVFRKYNFRYEMFDAEDVYGSIFLSLVEDDFRRIRNFRNDGLSGASTWLSVVATRMTIDYIRRESTRNRRRCNSEPSDFSDRLADDRPGPEQLFDLSVRTEALARVVENLDHNDARLYESLVSNQLSAEEIADVCGCSVQAMYTRKKRLAEKLKKMLAEL
jgi:RNA polymerase sigma factor (sigma-70 family)